MSDPQIPEYWSADQALAVYELLDDLLQAIWARYDLQIQAQLQADLLNDSTPQLDLFDPNDPIPF